MNKTDVRTINYYDKEIVSELVNKHKYEYMDAIRKFVNSKTHEMLENNDYMLWEFGTPGVLEIFLTEIKTGDPRNSVYLKED